MGDLQVEMANSLADVNRNLNIISVENTISLNFISQNDSLSGFRGIIQVFGK
jgi:hypothetical protein